MTGICVEKHQQCVIHTYTHTYGLAYCTHKYMQAYIHTYTHTYLHTLCETQCRYSTDKSGNSNAVKLQIVQLNWPLIWCVSASYVKYIEGGSVVHDTQLVMVFSAMTGICVEKHQQCFIHKYTHTYGLAYCTHKYMQAYIHTYTHTYLHTLCETQCRYYTDKSGNSNAFKLQIVQLNWPLIWCVSASYVKYIEGGSVVHDTQLVGTVI